MTKHPTSTNKIIILGRPGRFRKKNSFDPRFITANGNSYVYMHSLIFAQTVAE